MLLYPGYRNDQEILLACEPTCFKSPADELQEPRRRTRRDEEELAEVEEGKLRTGQQDSTIQEL